MRHTSLQEANTESLASGVGMRFRSFERRGNAFSKWFEGSEGFLGLPHARGSIAGTRIVASLDLVHSQNGLLLVDWLFIASPSQTSQHARPCAHLVHSQNGCLWVVHGLFIASLPRMLDLVHSQNGLLLVYSLFIDYLLPPFPECSTLCTPKRFIACLFVVY